MYRRVTRLLCTGELPDCCVLESYQTLVYRRVTRLLCTGELPDCCVPESYQTVVYRRVTRLLCTGELPDCSVPESYQTVVYRRVTRLLCTGELPDCCVLESYQTLVYRRVTRLLCTGELPDCCVLESYQTVVYQRVTRLLCTGELPDCRNLIVHRNLIVALFPPGTPISSSAFHRLDMTLAVAEALTPNKPNQTKPNHCPQLQADPQNVRDSDTHSAGGAIRVQQTLPGSPPPPPPPSIVLRDPWHPESGGPQVLHPNHGGVRGAVIKQNTLDARGGSFYNCTKILWCSVVQGELI